MIGNIIINILLLHCKEKSDLLKLQYLGSCKISKKMNEKIAMQRGKTNKLREEMTLSNWIHVDGPIFESYDDINNYILDLCKLNNINIIKKPFQIEVAI